MSNDQLKSVLLNTVSQIESQSETAKAVFTAETKLLDGVKCKAVIRNFSIYVDEPKNLGGLDTAPNPVELLLAALGTCQEIVYSAFAAIQGIPLDEVTVDVRGTLDLKGMFALEQNTPAGFNEITFKTTIKSSADEEEIKKLVDAVEAHCPLLDTLKRPINVKGKVNIVRSPATVQ